MPSLPLSILLRLLAIWLAIIAAETVQGALRTWALSEQVAFIGRQISVLSGVAVIFAITWFALPWMRIRSRAQALLVGLVWVALTLAFEIALGRALGFSWTRILSDFNVPRGGVLPFGLIAMGLTPWAVFHIRSRRRA